MRDEMELQQITVWESKSIFRPLNPPSPYNNDVIATSLLDFANEPFSEPQPLARHGNAYQRSDSSMGLLSFASESSNFGAIGNLTAGSRRADIEEADAYCEADKVKMTLLLVCKSSCSD